MMPPEQLKALLAAYSGRKPDMKRVFVCSPFRACSNYTNEENKSLTLRLFKSVMDAGHAPFAPHLLYPMFLNEDSPKERELGIKCGIRWLNMADELWVYALSEEQCTEGMLMEIEKARKSFIKMPVVFMPEAFASVPPRRLRSMKIERGPVDTHRQVRLEERERAANLVMQLGAGARAEDLARLIRGGP